MLAGEGLGQLHVGGFKHQLAALGHGIAGVDGQVEDDLLDLARVGFHPAQVGAKEGGQLDVFADQSPQHLLGIRHHRVKVEDLGLHDLLAAEGQELLSERGGAVGGLLDFLDVAAQGVVGAQAAQE